MGGLNVGRLRELLGPFQDTDTVHVEVEIWDRVAGKVSLDSLEFGKFVITGVRESSVGTRVRIETDLD